MDVSHGLSTLCRANLAERTDALLSSGGLTKASVLLARDGERRVVVKDFAGQRSRLRTHWGRWLLRRERKAYAALSGHPCVPRLVGQLDDLALVLISGGASALLSLPADGLSLADKQAVNRDLLASGAPIDEMNCVRKHLSAIKGGRLAEAAAPARVVTLAISDVPGDDPAVIGSGPTVGDPTTVADASRILAKYALTPPPAVRAFLDGGAAETPKPGADKLARAETHVIAASATALEAAAKVARAAGYEVEILGDALEGEARELAAAHAALARRRSGEANRLALLSGGETTVTVRGEGRGGRNAEYLLGLALALDGTPDIRAIACDTDGIDGTEDNAGAVIDPETVARARALGLDARAALERNDAYSIFQALGDLVVTGPTLTNVNDFRAILVR